jgi:putative serine protease PepD
VPFDDDADADLPAFRPPPHPDDRIWRHPSEMSAHPIAAIDASGERSSGDTPRPAPGRTGGSTGAGGSGTTGRPAGPPRGGRPWGAYVVAGTVGAVLAGVGVAAFGVGERVVERPVTERVALDTTVSALGAPDGETLDSVRQSVEPAVVGIEGADPSGAPDGGIAGSGVVVRDDGIVVTSISLVAAGAASKVRLADGRVVSADLVGTDPTTGLAVLDLDGGDHSPSVLAPTADLVVGETSFAVGAGAAGGTTTEAGVVGRTQRFVGPSGGALDGVEVEGDAAATDVGGPVVDARGAVVGISTAVDDGVAWHVAPVEIAHRVADGLLTDGVVQHARLGIEGTDVAAGADTMADGDGSEGASGGTGGHVGTGDGADGSGTGDGSAGGGDGTDAPADAPATMSTGDSTGGSTGGGGALVASVVEGSPADLGGLQAGDLVVALDGQAITHLPDLTVALRSRAPGDQVDVTVVRTDGTRTTLQLALDEVVAPTR